jgi:bifunctional non-homologous end joining protein LigD
VEPRLVAEVAFTEWTAGGSIRHPSFQGIREDKPAEDIVREDRSTAKIARRADDASGVRITHPERVVYPEAGLTKRDIADYYLAIGDRMLPHVSGRPLTLVRCPNGRNASCFYMKHSNMRAPSPLRRVRIPEKTKTGEYLVVESVEGLVALVQMNVLEIHTWNSTTAALEQPDRLVFDLDPGPDVKWPSVVDAARLLRRMLDGVDLASFPKTTGGRGLHLVVPLKPSASWNDCVTFARTVAETIERSDPARYTTAFRKAGREEKILVDYLRNNRTSTSIAALSTRARQNAPVSLPLRWEEVTASLDPASFTVTTVPERLRRQRRDPWAEYWTTKQALSAARLTATPAT